MYVKPARIISAAPTDEEISLRAAFKLVDADGSGTIGEIRKLFAKIELISRNQSKILRNLKLPSTLLDTRFQMKN